ncbi:MAG: hypothetical protein JNJ69_00915 [Leptospiraceae bacterium]|nr:hypothetical protein [Leptospiraceae bacterium]
MSLLKNFFVAQALWAILHAVCVLLSYAPFGFWPLGFVSVFAVLMAARRLRAQNLRRLLATWLFFAIATSLITFGWLVATVHTYTGERVVLTAALTLLYALLFQTKFLLFFLFYRYLISGEMRIITALASAAVLAVSDAISPELFPWCWGNTLGAETHLRQLASVGSVYLVSFTAALGAAIAIVAIENPAETPLRLRMKSAMPVLAVFAVLTLTAIAIRHIGAARQGQSLAVLAVQTNIGVAAETRRSDTQFATDAINRLFNQSLEGLLLFGRVNLIVWGEGAMPFHSAQPIGSDRQIYSPTFDAVIEYLHRQSGAAVIYQDLHYEEDRLHSRLTARPAAGDKTEYLKRRLVPWGEYLPLESAIPAMRRLFPEAGKLSTGKADGEITARYADQLIERPSRAQLLADTALLSSPEKIRSLPMRQIAAQTLVVKPVLCYEALFPSESRTESADLIVNLASDAWFGDGIEGQHHAHATTMRAVENGVPMVRAAVSGVSLITDLYGDDIRPRTGQGRPELLYAEVALNRRKTIFARFGMLAFYALMFVALWPFFLQRVVYSRK